MQHFTTRVPLLLSFLFVTASLLAAQEAQEPATGGQDPSDIVVELGGEQRARLRLAFPAPEAPDGISEPARQAVLELEATLRGDLEQCGIFDVQGPNVLSVLEITGDRRVDFELYRSLANEVLLLATVKPEGERIVLEARIFDLKSARSILGKRYRGDFKQARRIAHTLADEMVLYFSGRQGIALTRLAYTSLRPETDGHKELFLMDYDGYNQRQISGHKSLTMSPAWSPTGDAIAYVSFFSGRPAIYVVDLVSGNKSPLVDDGAHNLSPTFSPDGRQVAYARSQAGNSEIYVVVRGEEEQRRLTRSPGIDTNPAWSPDGREIAFTSSRTGSPQIYVMDPEGSDLRRVSFEGQYNDGAAWHPDGTKLAYASRAHVRAPFRIAILDLTTLESQLITSGEGSHESPTFSPNGRLIAFEMIREGRTQVYLVEVNGGNLRRLTSEGENFAPAWSNYLN